MEYAASVHGAPIKPIKLVLPSVSFLKPDNIGPKNGTSLETSDNIFMLLISYE